MIKAEILNSNTSKQTEIFFGVKKDINSVKVLFTDEDDSWVGIFDSGDNSEVLKTIVIDDNVVVFAYGCLNIINVKNKELLLHENKMNILDIEFHKEKNCLICAQENTVFSIKLNGEMLWKTKVPKVSTNGSSLDLVSGVKFVEINDNELKGRAYCCETSRWLPFLLSYPNDGEGISDEVEVEEQSGLMNKIMLSLKKIFGD